MHDIESRDQIGEEGNIMGTEELAQWVEVQVPLGEYQENDPDLLPLAAERLRELAAEVERLKAEVNDMAFRLGYAEHEAMRLKAHTWRQERDAVVDYIIADGQKSWPGTKRLMEILAKALENGEHWRTEGE